jgi:tungstate transport system permease protein
VILDGLRRAFALLVGLDAEVWGIVWVSLSVSIVATIIAALAALPVGVLVGLGRFRGRALLVTLLNTAMAMPTVLVGLVLYALLTRRGPLGSLDLLYTRTAMVIGQALLAFPLIAALAAAALEKTDPRILATARTLGASRARAALTVIAERRQVIAATLAAGFGRVFAEVGVSMMVGGNIRGHTRNITTGIAFETGRGEFALGLALGVVLLVVALVLNALTSWLELGRTR